MTADRHRIKTRRNHAVKETDRAAVVLSSKKKPHRKKKITHGPNGSTFLGVESTGNRVVYKANINDMNEDNPRLVLSKALLRRVPNIYITDEVEDMRLYIFSSIVIIIVKTN